MLLMSITEAAQAIGAKCGGSAPSADDMHLIQTLRFLTPRVEEALNVGSLTRQECTDLFFLADMPPAYRDRDREVTLRLVNGFVVNDAENFPITILDPEGEEIDPYYITHIDHEKGIVRLKSWVRGKYTVQYTSGFEPTEEPDPAPDWYDPDNRVLTLVPDWMKVIVIGALVMWYRTFSVNPRAPKDLSYRGLQEELRREIYGRVYGKYQRPRAGTVFADRT